MLLAALYAVGVLLVVIVVVVVLLDRCVSARRRIRLVIGIKLGFATATFDLDLKE